MNELGLFLLPCDIDCRISSLSSLPNSAILSPRCWGMRTERYPLVFSVANVYRMGKRKALSHLEQSININKKVVQMDPQKPLSGSQIQNIIPKECLWNLGLQQFLFFMCFVVVFFAPPPLPPSYFRSRFSISFFPSAS